MALYAAGFDNVVALMGSSMSEQQEALVLAHTNRVTFLFDGDDAGRACMGGLLLRGFGASCTSRRST